MRKQIRSNFRTISIAILATVGVCLLVVGVLGITDYIRTVSGISVPATKTITTTSRPSENVPQKSDEKYTVPADQPRMIEIPAIGVNSFVEKVGIDRLGAMATPNNIYFTGWYIRSSTPGEKGLSIINGHDGGRYKAGVFRRLKDLKANDDITVQMGNLQNRMFTVVSVKPYSVKDAASALFRHTDVINRELHLITCDGNFDDASQTYDQRLIVVAKSTQS